MELQLAAGSALRYVEVMNTKTAIEYQERDLDFYEKRLKKAHDEYADVLKVITNIFRYLESNLIRDG